MSAALFAGILLIVTVGYAARCWLAPFTACHRCNGTGTAPPTLTDRLFRRTPHRRALRGRHDCRHCRATGLRLRIGRRLFNHFRRIRRQATR